MDCIISFLNSTLNTPLLQINCLSLEYSKLAGKVVCNTYVVGHKGLALRDFITAGPCKNFSVDSVLLFDQSRFYNYLYVPFLYFFLYLSPGLRLILMSLICFFSPFLRAIAISSLYCIPHTTVHILQPLPYLFICSARFSFQFLISLMDLTKYRRSTRMALLIL